MTWSVSRNHRDVAFARFCVVIVRLGMQFSFGVLNDLLRVSVSVILYVGPAIVTARVVCLSVCLSHAHTCISKTKRDTTMATIKVE